jgi:large subunit ribosomal protein L43
MQTPRLPLLRLGW